MTKPKSAALAACLTGILVLGCVPAQSVKDAPPFEDRTVDLCLAYLIDQSGSFQNIWEEGGYDLFIQISEKFFMDSIGQETRVVIAQLSAAEEVVLFEGQPSDLRKRFQSPTELAAFLKSKSDPSSSPVYEATRRATDYLNGMPGIGENTRMLTVVFSDLADSEVDPAKRSEEGHRMLSSLTKYRENGGALALYYVDPDETPRWRQILDQAGFQPGHYVIENTLVANPQLPTF